MFEYSFSGGMNAMCGSADSVVWNSGVGTKWHEFKNFQNSSLCSTMSFCFTNYDDGEHYVIILQHVKVPLVL